MRYEIIIERVEPARRTRAVNITVIAQRHGMVIANATIEPENIAAFLSMVMLPDSAGR